MNPHWRRTGAGAPLLLGHRGTRSIGVENTMTSFEAALREGAIGIECDVRLDADMRVVVHHDASLQRVTQGEDERRIEDLASTELDLVRLQGGERIPTVLEVLDWANHRGAFLNVELKSNLRMPATLVVSLLEAIRRTRAKAPLLLSSFDPRIVSKLSQLAPHHTVGWLVEVQTYSDERECSWQRLGAQAVCSEWPLLTSKRAERWRADAPLLVAWTVNESRVALELETRGIDVLISDTPASLVAAFAAPR